MFGEGATARGSGAEDWRKSFTATDGREERAATGKDRNLQGRMCGGACSGGPGMIMDVEPTSCKWCVEAEKQIGGGEDARIASISMSRKQRRRPERRRPEAAARWWRVVESVVRAAWRRRLEAR